MGSRTISRHPHLNLSPATIRNVMADLEEKGFLWQPYTSAGRVPTERAFRFYVDYLLKVRRLPRREREVIREEYLSPMAMGVDVEELLRQAARILSAFSDYIGVVVAPPIGSGALKHIQFVRLSENQVLVILVSIVGIVEHKVIPIPEQDRDDLTQEELDRMSRYLSSELYGLTLIEMRERILAQMREEKVKFDTLLQKALRLGEQALSNVSGTQVYLEGKLNILKEPEFAQVEKMRAIFKAFEEKGKILKLLDKSLKVRGLSVFIGSEMEFEEAKELSLVTRDYPRGGKFMGTLGVIGPTRMKYSRVIALVDCVSELLTELLER